MKTWIIASVTAAALTLGGHADAAQYVFTMTGKVRSVEVSEQTTSGIVYRNDIRSEISIGDSFRLSTTIDTSNLMQGL